MSILIRIATLAGPYSGIGALLLGVLHWFFYIGFIELHILFGAVVTLSLLAAGIVALSRRGLRGLGLLSVVFAPVVPIFGMAQANLLVGGFHWVIRIAHLLVGAAAIALTERIGGRFAEVTAQDPSATDEARAA